MKVLHNRYDLKRVTRTLYDIQDMRKRIEGRLGIKSDGSLKEIKVGDGSNLKADIAQDVSSELETFLAFLQEREKILTKKQKEMIKASFPFGKVLVDYPGIDYKLAGVILSEIDIHEATTVSKLWRYTGGDPTAKLKKKEKGEKGEKRKYNKFVKTKLYGVMGRMSFLRKEHPMRPFYDARKMRREGQGWGKRPGHRHNDAVRYMVKMWIATWLYPTWRVFEGLPVRKPYQEEYLGKKHAA